MLGALGTLFDWGQPSQATEIGSGKPFPVWLCPTIVPCPQHLLQLALSVLLLSSLSCDKPSRVARPAGNATTLKVMSFNLNFGLPGDADSIAAIRSANPDLVLLQETNAAWEVSLRDEFQDLYPHMAFRHCCRAGGLALLSKGRILEDHYWEAQTQGAWFPAWHHLVETPLGVVQTLNLHLRPQISESGSVVRGYFSTPSIRREEIANHFEKLSGSIPTIIAGDFNENKDGDAIVFLAKRGLRSALPEFSPNADTWHWNTSVGTIHSQLDHIVYDPRLEPLDAMVVQQGSSDHWPVVATFVRAP